MYIADQESQESCCLHPSESGMPMRCKQWSIETCYYWCCCLYTTGFIFVEKTRNKHNFTKWSVAMRLVRCCLIACLPITLCSCLTTSGNYEVSAVDQQGNPLGKNTRMIASGSGIYTIRNALCMTYPGSIVYIKSLENGKHLDKESPYYCPAGK